MPKQNKKRTALPPFIPLTLRAYIEALDSYEISVVVALQFWHWWKGDKKAQCELSTKGVAKLAKMSDAKARSVLTKLKARGWVEAKRHYGKSFRYSLTIPDMSWEEGKAVATNWLPQLTLDDPQLAMWDSSMRSQVADEVPPQSELITSIDSKTQKNTPVGADALNPFGLLMQIFTDHGVRVFSRDPRQIGLINNIGKKLGREVFTAVATEYCINKYTKIGGRSIKGFLNNAERLADIAHQKGQSKLKRYDAQDQGRRDAVRRSRPDQRSTAQLSAGDDTEIASLGSLVDAFKDRLKADHGIHNVRR